MAAHLAVLFTLAASVATVTLQGGEQPSQDDVCTDGQVVSLLQTGKAVLTPVAERATPNDKLQACVSAYADGLDGVRAGLGDAIRASQLRPQAGKQSARKLVLGVGSGTTATRSLEEALTLFNMTGWHWADNETGFKEEGWTRDLLDILGRFDEPFSDNEKAKCHAELQAFDYTLVPDKVEFLLDSPTDQVFLHLFAAFPDAKFILTTRSPLEWAEQRRTHVNTLAPMQEPCGTHVEDFPEDEDLGQLLLLQNDLVRCAVPSHRLLEFDVFTDPDERLANLMVEIGDFVERPVPPGVTFPGTELLAAAPGDRMAPGVAAKINTNAGH